MSSLLTSFEAWVSALDEGFFILGGIMLVAELLRAGAGGRLNRRLLGDIGASLGAFGLFILVEIGLFAGLIGLYFAAHESLALVEIPVNGYTLAGTVLLADFVYYWEHRCSHQVRLLWMTHAVHHSSRHMNLAVAYRFGPFDSLIAFAFHLPLVLIGFDPVMVLGGQVLVLAYQTWLHTEMIGRLGPLESWINTPANHRVHHGCDPLYIDRNYGGILMFWDRLFGTYQKELHTPRYGLARDFESNNPLRVFVSELPGLWRDLASAASLGEVFGRLLRAPGWQPVERRD